MSVLPNQCDDDEQKRIAAKELQEWLEGPPPENEAELSTWIELRDALGIEFDK